MLFSFDYTHYRITYNLDPAEDAEWLGSQCIYGGCPADIQIHTVVDTDTGDDVGLGNEELEEEFLDACWEHASEWEPDYGY